AAGPGLLGHRGPQQAAGVQSAQAVVTAQEPRNADGLIQQRRKHEAAVGNGLVTGNADLPPQPPGRGYRQVVHGRRTSSQSFFRSSWSPVPAGTGRGGQDGSRGRAGYPASRSTASALAIASSRSKARRSVPPSPSRTRRISMS